MQDTVPTQATVPTFARAQGVSREELEAYIRQTPFATFMGASITGFGAGKVELTVPITDTLLQHHGFVHGAVIGFVADSACAWAAASSVGDVVTSEYKLNMIAPAGRGQLIGRGEVISISGKQIVCRADIFTQRDTAARRLVAVALATIVRLTKQGSTGSPARD